MKKLFWRPLLDYSQDFQLVVCMTLYVNVIETDYLTSSYTITDAQLSINKPTPQMLNSAIQQANTGLSIPYFDIDTRFFDVQLSNSNNDDIDISAIRNTDIIGINIIARPLSTSFNQAYTSYQNILQTYWLESGSEYL